MYFSASIIYISGQQKVLDYSVGILENIGKSKKSGGETSMIRGLTEEEKYKVIRPIIGPCEYDDYGIPIIRKTPVSAIDWNKLKAIGFKSASPRTSDKNTLVLMHAYDKELIRLWNNPLKYVGLYQGFAAVGSPDFSCYSSMNPNMIRFSIFKSRWIGVTWQNYNVLVLPTAIWSTPETYDLCFSSIERESVVIVSTLGCEEHPDVFLAGFNEMKKRINPPLIIVVGDMIDGMEGRFLQFSYNQTFSTKYIQMEIEGIPKVFEIGKEAM